MGEERTPVRRLAKECYEAWMDDGGRGRVPWESIAKDEQVSWIRVALIVKREVEAQVDLRLEIVRGALSDSCADLSRILREKDCW